MTKLEALCNKYHIRMNTFRKNDVKFYPQFFRGEGLQERTVAFPTFLHMNFGTCVDVLADLLEYCAQIIRLDEPSPKQVEITTVMQDFLGDEFDAFLCAPHKE